jgi:NADH-quinone oxidoreductase subunit L
VSGFFVRNAWLVPFLPLAGALTAAAAGRWLKGLAHVPVIVGIALAFLVSLGLLRQAGPEQTVVVSRWIDAGLLHVPIEFRVDGLTTIMLSMVTFVSTLVAIFASGYMAGEPGYPRFFAEVGLFVFSMTGLVLSNNYLLTYAFWEGVGVCSYLLIGFWYEKPAAAAAAKKAFLVNRVGDVGFAIAVFILWVYSYDHRLDYGTVLNSSNLKTFLPSAAITAVALLLFWAATAKSAQLPLYVWLPDAMEARPPSRR